MRFTIAPIAMIAAASMAFTSSARSGSAERTVEFTYVAHVPKTSAGIHRVRIWIPVPHDDAHQRISNVVIQSPIGYRMTTDSRDGNHFAYFDFSAAREREPFDIRMTFEALRYEYKASLPASDPPKSSTFTPEIARFLEPDRLIPIDGVIGDLSREQTAGISDPLAKARAIYQYVIRNMKYDHAGTGWGRGDAVWACSAHHGNCTDFHSLFIGMARAAGIPARFEIGFPLPPDAQGTIGGYHCWAEFYVSGIGWVPVDASEAWQNPEKRDYFFGAIDENRVRFSVGRDLELSPKQQGEPVNFLVYPYAEADGKPFAGIKNEFTYRDRQRTPAQ